MENLEVRVVLRATVARARSALRVADDAALATQWLRMFGTERNPVNVFTMER
jgi:hypothetical protein